VANWTIVLAAKPKLYQARSADAELPIIKTAIDTEPSRMAVRAFA
jgi:hypothetical protein